LKIGNDKSGDEIDAYNRKKNYKELKGWGLYISKDGYLSIVGVKWSVKHSFHLGWQRLISLPMAW